MQICSVCKESKALSEFHANKNRPNGRTVTCKSCAGIRSKTWAKENRSRVNECYRKNYALNLEDSRRKRRERVRKWETNNPEKKKEAQRNYHLNHPEKRRLAEHKRRTVKEANGVFYILEKEIKSLLSTPCANCGTLDNITLDHVIPISRGGRHSFGNLQALCKSCNSSKNNRTITEWKHSKKMLGVS